jgi:hypothetical protein
MQPPSEPDYLQVFRAIPAPSLVLDTDLVIRDANPAYLEATQRSLDDLLGRDIFDAFPANPSHPDGDGVAKLRASLATVLTRSEPHSMLVQRYDIPAPDVEGFHERYWTVVNAPILTAAGELEGILHSVEDVTPFRDDLRTILRFYRDEASSQDGSGALTRRFTDYATVTMANTRLYDLTAEVEQLHDALSSRAVIEQAKGIVMTHRRCSADEAFQALRQLSQDRNVKLRDIATALVERAEIDPSTSITDRSDAPESSSTGR